jgi:8-oxo-dGTP diphosphatase
MNKIIPVSCAVIFSQGKILAVRRSSQMPLAGFWEFPGGKLENGESPQECLEREILEELELKIQVGIELPISEYSYLEEKTIRLIPFLSQIKRGEINLLEHDQYLWLGVNELFEVNWAIADIPIVQYLKENWSELITD